MNDCLNLNVRLLYQIRGTMNIIYTKEKLERLDQLIKLKATGSPRQLAKKNQWYEPQSKLWKQYSAESYGELYYAFSSAEAEREGGLNTTERTVYRIIKQLKEIGCPIYFDKERKSYCYQCIGEMTFKSMTLNRNKRSAISIASGIDPAKTKSYAGYLGYNLRYLRQIGSSCQLNTNNKALNSDGGVIQKMALNFFQTDTRCQWQCLLLQMIFIV